jgi:hypothetical protein
MMNIIERIKELIGNRIFLKSDRLLATNGQRWQLWHAEKAANLSSTSHSPSIEILRLQVILADLQASISEFSIAKLHIK